MRRDLPWAGILLAGALFVFSACGESSPQATDGGPQPECTTDADCSDGVLCNGAETCAGGTCTAGSAEADGTACTVGGQSGTCSAGACVATSFECSVDGDCDDGQLCNGSETCLNGTCEDGSAVANGTECTVDGAAGKCSDGACVPEDSFVCSADAQCTDGDPCNGDEFCDDTSHCAVQGQPLADGTDCGSGKKCIAETCQDTTCGNLTIDAGEDCDDGNADPTDGCTNLCKYTCVEDTDCDDGEVCNGVETCSGHVCQAAAANVDDGTQCIYQGGRGFCTAGACAATRCGDGYLDADAGELCDDGNTDDTDGCKSDCTFSCTTDDECQNASLCDGAETCVDHVCQPAAAYAADGTSCDTGKLCTDGQCLPSRCGDGYVDAAAGEDCDDANLVDTDGCTSLCKWTCTAAADCDDNNACTTGESCNIASHTCVAGSAVTDGTTCGSGRICLGGVCKTAGCGDGVVSGSEQCDDGNTTNGDGCDNDCTWTCVTNADCSDGKYCTGIETCSNHLCKPGTAPTCDDHDTCTVDSCAEGATSYTCNHARLDNDGDGFMCNNNCSPSIPGCDCDDSNASVTSPQPWYRDCDADGYALAGASTVTQCAMPATTSSCKSWTHRAPSTTSAQDCLDTNALVYPGASTYRETSFSVPQYCAIRILNSCIYLNYSYNYNCSGDRTAYNFWGFPNWEERYTNGNVSASGTCASSGFLCGSEGWVGNTAACGASASYTYCETALHCSGSLCLVTCTGNRITSNRTQSCR